MRHRGGSPAAGELRSGIRRGGTVVWWAILAALVGVAVAAGPAFGAAAATYPLDEVKPGLKGYGLTVVEGTRIERFDVDVLGVVRRAGPAGDLILVKVSGAPIERSGGIAAGMSGSPVYVNGRLLGAIGFGFEFTDHTVGFVTPIGDMLQVLDRLSTELPVRSEGAAGAATSGLPAYRRVAFARDASDAHRIKLGAGHDTAVMVPVSTPLMLSGFGPRATAAIERLFAPYRLLMVPGGAGAAAGTGLAAPTGAASSDLGPAPPLQPGSAFGVSLVQGDVELTAIGTVTYVDGDRFVGFGHPFLQAGAVDFFAGPAYIFRTVKAVNVPFKLGSLMTTTGVLREDRRAAVAGRTGVMPDAVQLAVTLTDRASNRSRTLKASVVRDELLTIPLVAITSLEALDRGLDRIGPGTARVIFRITGKELPDGGTYSRDNMYYSRFDVSARLLGDFLDTLQALMFNRFQDIGVRSVQLEVEVDPGRQTAAIVKAQPLAKTARPGDRVGVEVELLPYRGQRQTRILTLQIPKDALPGTVTVTVRGGSAAAFTLPPEVASLITGEAPPAGTQDEGAQGDQEQQQVPSSLDKLIEALSEREKNNQVVAEFYPGFDVQGTPDGHPTGAQDPPAASTGRMPSESQGAKGKQEKAAPREPGEPVKATLLTPWVVEGSADFDLEIVEAPAPSEPNGGDGAAPSQKPPAGPTGSSGT